MNYNKIEVLRDFDAPPGKKFALVAMISPESRQKNDVHAFKIFDVCGTQEEGEALVELYHRRDPEVDIYLVDVGKWAPWIWNPLDCPNVKYSHEFMTELIHSHRTNKRNYDTKWRHDVEQDLEKIRHAGTKEGQAELANKKEPAISVWFKIQQLQTTIKRRKEELEIWEEIFHTKYTRDERQEGKKAKLPLSEPLPMQYELLGSGHDDENQESHVQQGSSSLA